MLVWAYHQRVSRLKNVAEKLKIRYVEHLGGRPLEY